MKNAIRRAMRAAKVIPQSVENRLRDEQVIDASEKDYSGIYSKGFDSKVPRPK